VPFPAYVLSASLVVAATMLGVWLARRQPWAAAGIAGLGAIVLLILHGPLYFDYYADDALITLRYSRNLADGLGPTWNSEGRVDGYTTFLWMGVHAGLAKLGVDIVAASRVLGAAAVVGTLGALAWLWDQWRDEAPQSALASPFVLAAAFIALVLSDAVAFWGFSGMETAAFMALLTLSAVLFLREQREGSILPWSALAFAATAMTRPEGLIAVAVTGAFLAAGIFASTRRRDADRSVAVTRFASWSLVFVALYGSYFVWRFAYYDYLLPNTFYAKVEPTGALYERGLEYVWTYGLRYQLLPLLAGAALLLAQARLRYDAAYVIALAAAMLAGVVIEGGDDFPHGRMIAPVLPLVYLTGLAGLATLLDRLSVSTAQKAGLAGAVLVLGMLSLFRGSLDLHGPVELEKEAFEEREALGRWLAENTPEDYTVAAFAVGAIGYHSERDVLDLLGLNDTTIAHSDVPGFGTGLAGHEKYNTDYVLEDARPEIIVTDDAQPGPLDSEQFRAVASVPSPVAARNALFQDPRLWAQYDVVSVEVDGHWFNFLQRKDTMQGFVRR